MEHINGKAPLIFKEKRVFSKIKGILPFIFQTH